MKVNETIGLMFVVSLLACACAKNTSGTAVCGDGKKNGSEACDGTELGDATCQDLGFYGGVLLCSDVCQFDTRGCAGFCGDGIVQNGSGEECDQTAFAGADCENLGYHGGSLSCTQDCRLDLSGCEAAGRCGDGVHHPGNEDCDGAIPAGITCATVGGYTGTLTCNADCTFGLDGCERCGDGIIQSAFSEVCDGDNLGSNTCVSLGLPAGELACRSTCQYELAGCNQVFQFGTALDDRANDVALTSDNHLILVGSVSGDFNGRTHSGMTDGFVARYNPTSGQFVWTQLLGTEATDTASGVAMDASGNIYVAGTTRGALQGFSNAGNEDSFLVKFSSSGSLQWVRQWGTPVGDWATSVVVDGNGHVLVAGYTHGGMDGHVNAGATDVFLVKHDADGTRLWTRQWGTVGNDYGYGVAVGPDNSVYVTGNTFGGMDGNVHQGSNDIFLTKHDENGARLWTRQIGTTGNDGANGVAVDASGNIYIAGYTVGDLAGQGNLGGYDIFLAKYSPSSEQVFLRQHGTTANDYCNALFIHQNNLYLAGRTDGPLDGNPQAGAGDGFVSRWTLDGAPLWSRKWGSDAEDRLLAITSNAPGRVFAVGYSAGSILPGTGLGMEDILVIATHGLP